MNHSESKTGTIWTEKAENYIDAAIDHLNIVKSDHFATVLLEVKSDIDKSVLDMAKEYKLTSFVANNRVERVSTSIMNDFEFLRPINRYEAFKLNHYPLNYFGKIARQKGSILPFRYTIYKFANDSLLNLTHVHVQNIQVHI